VEVKNKKEIASLSNNHLIVLIFERHILVRAFMHERKSLLQPMHGSIKGKASSSPCMAASKHAWQHQRHGSIKVVEMHVANM